MNEIYKSFKYYRFRQSITTLFILGLVVPFIHLITLEKNASPDIKYTLLPILLSGIAIIVISFCRKVLLGKLLAHDIDFTTIYQLEKRKENPKNKYNNLKLLTNVYFYTGDFQKVLSYSSDILKSHNTNDVFYARHIQILTLFITGEYDAIPEMINLQKSITGKERMEKYNDVNDYYLFITFFINGNYSDAIDFIKKVFTKKDFEKLNHKKILVFYFLRMAYKKINDIENVQVYTKKIICSDPNNCTFFRYNVEHET